jgi:hypothetical protein
MLQIFWFTLVISGAPDNPVMNWDQHGDKEKNKQTLGKISRCSTTDYLI